MNAVKRNIFTDITKKQNMEFGLVTILATCFLAIYSKESSFITAAFILTLITIIIPVVFYPFTALWFGLSRILGTVSSMIILSVIFFLMVTPVAAFRRMMGKDVLRLKAFKKSDQSVFVDREHLYSATDMTDTF